jgi:hypothetical protein
VGNGLTGVSEWLRGEFEQAAKEAERSIVFHRTICKFLAPQFEFASYALEREAWPPNSANPFNHLPLIPATALNLFIRARHFSNPRVD